MSNYIDGSFTNIVNSFAPAEEAPATITRKSGGVVSLQFGAPEQSPYADDAPRMDEIGATVRNPGERYVWNSFSNSVERAGPASVNTADFNHGLTGVLSTVQSSTLSPINPNNLNPNDTIEVDGVRFTLEIAEQIGIVTRDERGRYMEAPQAPVQAREAASSVPAGEAFGAAAEAGLAALVGATTPHTQVAVFSEIARSGSVSGPNLGRLASEAGIEPAEAARWIDGIMGEFESQAERSLAKMGVTDPVAFASWAADNGYKTDVADAMYKHITERTTEGYRPIAEQFVLTMDKHSPDLILNAEFGRGIRAIRGADGEPVIEVDGKTYGWASALRAGIVRIV